MALRAAEVDRRVVLVGDREDSSGHTEGEARFQLEEFSVASLLDLLAYTHRGQLESHVAVHGAEQEQRSRAAFLQHLRCDLEVTFLEGEELGLVSELLRCVDQSWEHGEAAATPAAAGVALDSYFDRLITNEGVLEDAVAQLSWKLE